jgi:hypothetical protein
MNVICGDPLDDRHETTSSCSTASHSEGILECDYDTQCTKLYKLIENKQWDEVLYFLDTGKFYDTTIFTTMCGTEPDPPSVQARTWVTALNEEGDVRWCQLPLHAAVTFLAPFSVIESLIKIYPKSVRCADDQDMLPLHYAFRFGAADDVMVYLLDKFPQAIGKKAVKNRLPLDMAKYGPNPERRIIIDYYIKDAIRTILAERDREYEKMVTVTNSDTEPSMKEKLLEAENDLVAARKEIDFLRAKVAIAKKNATSELRVTKSPPPRTSTNRKSNQNNVSNQNISQDKFIAPRMKFGEVFGRRGKKNY